MRTENFEIRKISSADTRLLRHKILRPNQNPEELFYPGDDSTDTVHFGLFLNGTLNGIASVYREPMENEADGYSWRLRGMATSDEARGMGFGRELMNACIEHIRSKNGKVFWCNARTTAEEFYEKFGMKRTGDVFYPEGLGEHVVMKMNL
ncbi:MAG: GNAT family N-acetyltransferase [Bacteroidetes bacterium]|nr:GNAT family N-acetyltransferase [Bacteroidota bacterium]